jgi:hypothetical protein
MEDNKVLRELNTPSVGWVPISLDFGRDEALCEIEDENIILAAAGLAVAGVAACLAKDGNWLSRNEVLRAVIPGSKETKLAAAEALCSVGLWEEESRGSVQGWRIGVESALAEKRKRIDNATNAANARYKAAREKKAREEQERRLEEESLWGPSEPFEE